VGGAFALSHSATVSEPYERWARRVMGAVPDRRGESAGPHRGPLHREGVRAGPSPPLPRLLPPARLPPRPDAEHRRHGGGRRRLLPYRDVLRGTPAGAQIRRGVPGVPTPRAALPPAPAAV